MLEVINILEKTMRVMVLLGLVVAVVTGLIAAVVTGSLVFSLFSGNEPRDGMSETTVNIQDYSFNPGTLRVAVGTRVTWVNMDTDAHSVISGTPNQPTGFFQSSLLGRQQSFSYTFDTPGTYAYYCGPHSFMMTGTIVVE